MARHLTSIEGIFYRMLFVDWAGELFAPARSPEGRSHYAGQKALYLSETPEGCMIASRRYRKVNDPKRAIYPLLVQSSKIIDLRDPVATEHYGIDVTHRAAEWQDFRARGEPSPTWVISDHVRALKSHGILYASRSQPSLTHLTLFDWNTLNGATVSAAGDPVPDHS